MTDFIDRTQDRDQPVADARIENRVRYVGVSATHCKCGEPIPERRRKSLAGIKTCVYCAELEGKRK